jgi:hypothetical protein
MLSLELKDLSDLGVDLATLGFTPQELAAALAPGVSSGLTDENEVPELLETAVTRAGDIWCLEPHRVACGDSTDEAVVKALFGMVKPHLMVTDPPYGVDYDPAWRHRAGVNRSGRLGKVHNDERADWEAAWTLFPGRIVYVWARGVTRYHGGGEPDPPGLRHPCPDHLGERAVGDWSR